ncbi:MAG: OmpP1/FadL family transporter [Xanthobacter sp.]
MKIDVAKVGRLLLVAGGATGLSVEHAQAGAFGLNEYGAAGTGLAASGTAAGSAGLASMAFNPATLSEFDGLQASATLSYIKPLIHVDAPTGNTDDIANGGRPVPAAQLSYQVNGRFWIGVSVDAPFGLMTDIAPELYTSYYGTKTEVVDINVTPTIAYKITDWLSIGAGLQINYLNTKLNSRLTPLMPEGYLNLNADGMSLGYKLGVLLKPFEGTVIGVGYRSEVSPSLDGTLENNIPFPGLSGLVLPGRRDISLDLTLPAQLNVGLRQVLTPDFTLNMTYQWTNWSAFNRFIVSSDSGPVVPLNFDYRDGWLVAGGLEYKWSAETTLRAGINYEESPITAQTRDPRLPDSNRIMVGLGGSYQYSKNLSFDFGYAHVFMREGDIVLTDTSNPRFTGVPFIGSAHAQVDIAALTVNYKW